MFEGIKEWYQKIKVQVVEGVLWAERELQGRSGEEKKAAVVKRLDEMIVLPFYLEWLDNYIIAYLVDLACEKLNWLTDWLFGHQEGTTDIEPQQAAKVAALLDVPVADLPVAARSVMAAAPSAKATSEAINERLNEWYEQYGIKPETPDTAEVEPEAAPEVVPVVTPDKPDKKYSDFDEAISFTLRWEGGYVNHPDDPGGETNMGITKGALGAAYANGLVPHNSVKDLTREQAKAIYRAKYWDKVGCGKMTDPIGKIVFDLIVNHGQAGMTRIVQRACNVVGAALAVDGKYGAKTKAALFEYMESHTAALAEQLLMFRKKLYDDIVAGKPSQRVFLKGWYNRLNGLAKATVGRTVA